MAIDLADKSPNGNTLTNSGAAEVTTSLAFAGSSIGVDLEASESDYLYAADSSSLSIVSDITLEILLNFESLPSNSNMWFMSKYDDTGNKRCYAFGITDSAGAKVLRFIISPDGNYSVSDDIQKSWTPSTATWYRVGVTWTASTKTVKFYVDGSQQGTDGTTAAGSIFNSDNRLALGCINSTTTPADFFDGVMDDVRVWSTARSGTDLNNTKLVELTGTEPSLAAYWPFETLFVPQIIIS